MSLSAQFFQNLLRAGAWCVVVAVCTEISRAESAADIYQQKCASCHGDAGQGVEGFYDGPLFGELSIDELVETIDITMPEDDPDACVGDEARQVAAYIFDAFYSKAARRRNGQLAATRVELVRLTEPQYRNAVADLLLQFTPPPRGRRRKDPSPVDSAPFPRGLKGEYFESNQMNKADIACFERIDPVIEFDFDRSGPERGMAGDAFAIIWNGSITTPTTGDYEFRIRTENGVRLYLNGDDRGRDGKLRDDSDGNRQTAFIDGWVSSGSVRDRTGKIFLLGGRTYPLRLEFFKYLDATASVELQWRPPHGVWSVIEPAYLSPEPARRTWVVDTRLPADDRSLGYERGSAVSHEWQVATTHAAAATAAEVVDRLRLLSGVGDHDADDGADDRAAKLGEFLVRFARAAYRRPLTDDEQRLFGETVFETADDVDAAVYRAVLLALTSPHFLYANLPPDDEAASQHQVASQLALAIWDSIPDRRLGRAADERRLAKPRQIERHARRMLDDPRTRQKLRTFFRHWLELEERDLAKDEQMFPEFDDAVIADLRRSLELFVDEVVWSDTSDYRQLLLADYLLVNDRLRNVYRDELELETAADCQPCDDAASDFTAVRCVSSRRSGILTHPYLLSAFAYHNNTSPIHRGVFLTRNIVGRGLKPPPVAVAFEDSKFAPELTMREKITELTREQACMSCHSVINPLGFALENFDAVGRWRTEENDRPIDARSQYTSEAGETLDLACARDIAEIAIHSESAQQAFVMQLFNHLVKQNPYAYGPEVVDRLRTEFANDGFNVQNLVVRIAVVAASATASANQTEPLP